MPEAGDGPLAEEDAASLSESFNSNTTNPRVTQSPTIATTDRQSKTPQHVVFQFELRTALSFLLFERYSYESPTSSSRLAKGRCSMSVMASRPRSPTLTYCVELGSRGRLASVAAHLRVILGVTFFLCFVVFLCVNYIYLDSTARVTHYNSYSALNEEVEGKGLLRARSYERNDRAKAEYKRVPPGSAPSRDWDKWRPV